MRREAKTLLWVVIGIVIIMAVGTVGYMLIEGWGLLDAVYMTVTTITTVGFEEVEELSEAGRIFTIVLILCGVGVILYGLATIVEYAIQAQLSGLFKRRTVKKQMDKLQDHYIICGYGRVGESVAKQFTSQEKAFVVVESDPESLARAEGEGYLAVEGDATSDEALEAAGIKKAKGVIAAAGSDAANIYVTLSARVLNRRLLIVARASSEDAVSKLKRAGADRVVSPYAIGGRQMAALMLGPMARECQDVFAADGELEFRVEELRVGEDGRVVGRSIQELSAGKSAGTTILAIRRGESGAFDTDPATDAILHSGDTIVAIGPPAGILELERLVGTVEDSRGEGGAE